MNALFLMLLADARLPAGGHTQSAGLEPALRAGSSDLPAYIALRLRTVTRVEAATAVVALHHFNESKPWKPVDDAWALRTPSPAMRQNSRQLARGLVRLGNQLWELPPLEGASRGVVLGAIAHAVGLKSVELVHLVGYDDVQTVAAAALKLMPLDPAMTLQWTVSAFPAIESLAGDVAPLTAPGDIPASSAPQIEQWAEAHALETRRLFSA
jgi:urease accessory protein